MKNQISESQILEILDVIQCYAAEDYSVSANLYGKNDNIDALAMGINMMGEELEGSRKERDDKICELEKSHKILKTTRKKILEEKEKFKSLTENIAIGIFRSTRKGSHFIEVNPAMVRIFGYKNRQELLAANPVDLYANPNDRALLIGKLGEEGSVEKVEINYIRKDGSVITCSVSAVSQFKKTGQIDYLDGIVEDITERKLSEKALKESEERYRELVENANDIIYGTDKNGFFTFVNNTALQYMGYSEKELVGKHFSDLICPEYQRGVKRFYILQVVKKTLNTYYEFPILTKQGKKMWLGQNVQLIMERGQVIGIQSIARDITERKKIEFALKERMKELQCVYGITEITETQGITLDELYQEAVFLLPPGWQYPEITCSRIRIAGKNYQTDNFTKTKWKQKADIRLKNHLIGTVEVYYLEKKPDIYEGPFLREERNLINAIAKRLSEYTEQKELQNEIVESEELLNNITTSAQDGIIVIDHNGKVVFWNNSAEAIFGYTTEEITGKNFHEIITPAKYHDSHDKGFEAFKKTGKGAAVGQTLELSALTKDGKEFPVELSLSAMKIKNNWHGVGIIRDITKRKEIEEQLEEAKTQAEQANQAKSEFLANMSHEIRTPMNAILGFAEILEDQLSTTSEYHDYVTGIRNSGKGLLGLINDILDLSKIEAGKLEINYEPISPHAIIDEIRQIYYLKTKEKKLNFEINVDPDLPKGLLFDETRLRQILFNLIGNAIKFTNEGGITVKFKSKDGYEAGSHIDLFIEVIDTGIGICEKSQKIIFEPFRQKEGQSTRRYGGTGLGLTITKRLVSLMNGTISLKSEVDKGSTFEIFLPRIQVSGIVESPASEVEAVSGIEFKNPQILLVDDVESNRKVVRGYLESFNVRIIEAENGSIGIEQTRKYKPDLILMDLQMPGIDGYEATGIIKAEKELRNVPIIALTASSLEREKSKIENLCDGFLRKPVSKSLLISELKKFLPFTKQDKPEEKGTRQEIDYIHELKQLALLKNRIPKKLVDIFRKRIIPEHENILKNRSNKRIRNFASIVSETGKEFNIDVLEDYGMELEKYLNSFNVKKINVLLTDFKEMAEIISK